MGADKAQRGYAGTQGVEQRIQLLQQQIARARTPQEAHPLRKQLAELQAILQNMGPTR
jgi:hypothetical protein